MADHRLLSFAESRRKAALATLDGDTQSELGQFFTPVTAAVLIASLARLPETGTLKVLDPGAGSGVLSAALVDRVLKERPGLSLHILAVERDSSVLPYLKETLAACEQAGEGRITAIAVEADFIMYSTGLDASLLGDTGFDVVIQNPPYGKLASTSPHRKALLSTGVDAPNLYAAFLALSAEALLPGGQLVAITPRSFFNGAYFGSFRGFLLDRIALDRVHVFESRSTVFADTGVLQENVIFSGTRDGERKTVELSVSRDHNGEVAVRQVPYCDVVRPNDVHRFIRLVTDNEDDASAELMMSMPCSLADLGVTVSTGRVVDFRSRDALHDDRVPDAHPLIYPGNLRAPGFEWPRDIRKPQWFAPKAPKDVSLLLPEGWYTVVKRFSSKEERRRVVASAWSPVEHPGPVAFENHLNVFHIKGTGLDEAIARGLAAWLNSSLVDRFFRTFSGHTQVNATDLRALRFPTSATLKELGQATSIVQSELDAFVLSRITA